MGALKKDVLLILFIMSICITQVTSREGIVSPGHSFNLKSEGTKSGASHAAKNVARKIKKHVLGLVYGECVTRALLEGRAHH